MSRSGKRRQNRFNQLGWFLQYLFVLLLLLIVRLVPLGVVYKLGGALGLAAHRLGAKYRVIVHRNLRIVLYGRGASMDEIDSTTREVFRRTGANLVSALKTATISDNQLGKIISVENKAIPEQELALRGGIILLLAHMGNWEILAQIKAFLPEGCLPGTHYRPLNNPYVDRLISSQREHRGTRLFAKESSTHQIGSFLRERGALGILADQRAGPKSEICTFFGRLTGCTPLPSLLARRSGCGVSAIALSTVGPARWLVRFIPVTPPYSTQNLMNAVEGALASSPSDGFWFQNRWALPKRNPLSLPGRLPDGPLPEFTTPCRIPVWKAYSSEIVLIPEDSRPDLLVETQIHDMTTSLSEIDRSQLLPIEAIVVGALNPRIVTEARKLGVPVIVSNSLTETP